MSSLSNYDIKCHNGISKSWLKSSQLQTKICGKKPSPTLQLLQTPNSSTRCPPFSSHLHILGCLLFLLCHLLSLAASLLYPRFHCRCHHRLLKMINDITIITININSSRLTINIVVNFVIDVRLTSINPRVFAVRTRRCIFLFMDFLLISCKQNVNLDG